MGKLYISKGYTPTFASKSVGSLKKGPDGRERGFLVEGVLSAGFRGQTLGRGTRVEFAGDDVSDGAGAVDAVREGGEKQQTATVQGLAPGAGDAHVGDVAGRG